MIPIYKAEDTGVSENYRPISLILHVGKLIDKTLHVMIREEHVFRR